MKPSPILTVKDLSVVFPDSNGGLHALENISFEVCPRDFICFLGPSGSGKSSLLYLLGLLDVPSSGEVLVGGAATSGLDDAARTRLRLAGIAAAVAWRTGASNAWRSSGASTIDLYPPLTRF